MRDDITRTDHQPHDTIGAQLAAFRQNPGDRELYLELKAALRKAGQNDQLAEIAELRAPHERDPGRAAKLWTEAGEARLAAGNTEYAEQDLREALILDPANARAAAKLAKILVEAERHAEAASVLEVELDDLERRAEAADSGDDNFATQRAERHRLVAHIWDKRLGRVDRALHHYQRAWQLEPQRTESLEAARAIYASLGDDKMVAQLYEAELKILDAAGEQAPRERHARILLELGRLRSRVGDSEAAARHLERSLEIAPKSGEAREALAEVYASPAFAGESERQRRAGELFVELGQRHMATEDGEAAISYLRRALGVDPYSRAGIDTLENALTVARRWDELDRLYRHRLAIAESTDDKVSLLLKRAKLYEERLEDRDSLKRVLEQLAAMFEAGNDYARRLRQLYTEDSDWKELIALIEHGLGALENDPPRLIAELLELATVSREHLRDRDRSAEYLHRVLSIDSRHEEGLARYAEHFRERRDWRGLADLTEFTIENFREAGAPASELVRRLEELAQLCEVRLGDVERAIHVWRRIEELEPENRKAREALRRLMSRAKMWEQLVGVLEQEAQQAQDATARAEALRRIGQVYRERQVNPRRAIALYEEVLTLFPDDDGALKALTELYEREGDDGGLATTIRRQLDLDLRRLMAEIELSGQRPPTAREWPVAKRVERLTALRRLAAMYEDRLADVEGVVFACSGILEILPGDREALERMERVLEKAGDIQRLEQTLEYHAAAATGPAEKARVLRRLARLAAERSDEVAAMERWEQVLKAAPNDAEALDAVAELFERHSRWGELATVLERVLVSQKLPEPGTPQAAERADKLKRYARVVDDRLGDAIRATKGWSRVLEVLPRDRDALEALGRLYEQGGHWRELADVLEKQLPLYKEDDPAKAAEVALQRAQLLEQRLGAPKESTEALEALVGDIDPSNVEAHQMLRRLYEARGDFEAAVRVAEREIYLTEAPKRKIARGLEIGVLCRDRLGDPTRALQAFERVLRLEPENQEALGAAADLYARVGDWRKHIQALERRIELTEGRDRRTLILRVAQATAERLGEHRAAFKWFRKAHEHAPDATTIAELRRAAEAYGLWRELADVYESERQKLSPQASSLPGVSPRQNIDEQGYVAACRELAAIAERRLNDPKRAIDALYDALSVQPQGEDLISEAERIAADADEGEVWERLLATLALPIDTANTAGKVAICERRARILEERLGDPEGAAEELLKAFSWAPDRDEIRQALYDLAERGGFWKDVISVETAIYQRAPSTPRRLEILRRKADVLEEKLEDRVRAFRTHISAFLLSPEDQETIGHLWRLAREINSYEEKDRTPSIEPPAAYVAPEAGAVVERIVVEATKPTREPTEELSVSDLIEPLTGEEDAPRRGDRTMTLDISELQEVGEGERQRENPTMELRTQDLIEVLRPEASPPPAPQRRPTPEPSVGKGPPPPPPPRPTIKKRPGERSPAPARQTPAAKQAPRDQARKAPTLPSRAYSSPWSELAAAYEALPAPNLLTRLQWLYRAAEVWATGAEEISRAFDILAKALEIAPGEPEPRARLYQLAEDYKEWDRLAELYDTAAEGAGSAEAARDLLMEVAEIRSRQERPRETETIYRRILGMRPEDAPVREKLEALYRSESRWVDLAASLEERTDPRLGAAAPEAERPALLRELADVYSDKLGRKHDAIEALERLRTLDPEDIEVMDELAALYGEIGRWKKVIGVLGRIADAADGTAEARKALATVGRIYEVELELPDRAIEAYSQLVSQWPDESEAYEALDRLYQQHARWEELSDILRRRAALARDPQDRARLLRRRAMVLMEWLDAPEEAAAALRHARTIQPDAPDLADELVQALTKAGRDREAAAVLEGRIAALKEAGESEGNVAALLIRLAALRAEKLRNSEGAKQVLEEALELVPDHPTALATLAKLAEARQDPSAFAAAKLREAEVQSDVDAKVEALLAAGVALRDKVRDIEKARSAFEKVLELRPYHAAATWALAGLVEQGGDLEKATKLLEARLEAASLDEVEQAQVLTQLAALSRQAGVDAAAERRLGEALEVLPDYMAAILARADLLDSNERHDELEDFLKEVIPRLEEKPPEARAEIHRRLAMTYEKLDRPDDAYQTLLEADRIQRGNLLVKLALGENRYRARRWREAALHLGALASHKQAERYPAEVAEGLYHAALAEIRSLRPEKAEALYERALELKPNYAPALQTLSELAIERGDHKRAADLLTRQASSTEDPEERTKRFEALGDMALMTLKDEERARICYEAAVNSAVPLEEKHLPLLEKLLERQDIAGDHAGTARTAELMASFAADGPSRAARLRVAAESYQTADQKDRARAAAERAVQADPHDLLAASLASEMMVEEGAYDEIAAMLGRTLMARAKKKVEPANEVEAARLALLWHRLGHARLERGDKKGATAAFESSLKVAPDSDGALLSRRKLLSLWEGNSEKGELLLEFRRMLAADTLELDDIAEYARALVAAGRGDGGRALLELAGALGHEPTKEDVAFLGEHPARQMAEDEAYKGVLGKNDRAELISDEDDRPLAAVLSTLWEAAALLWGDAKKQLAALGMEDAERVGATTDVQAAAVFTRIARALDTPATLLYATRRDGAPDVQVVCASPPIVVLGPSLQGIGADQPSDLELRFVLGRAAELARPERVVAAGTPPEMFAELLASLARVFGGGAAGGTEESREQDEVLRKTLPVKVRTKLKKLLEGGARLDAERYLAACHRAADRTGLLVSGDFDTALRLVRAREGGSPGTRHLERLVLTRGYLRARAELGVGAIK